MELHIPNGGVRIHSRAASGWGKGGQQAAPASQAGVSDVLAPPTHGIAALSLHSAPPSHCAAPPTHHTASPNPHTAPPTHQTAPPTQHTAPPTQHTAPPNHHTAPPNHHTAPPTHHTAPPNHHTAPPNHHTAPPNHHTASPNHHTAPPTHHTASPTQWSAAPTHRTAARGGLRAVRAKGQRGGARLRGVLKLKPSSLGSAATPAQQNGIAPSTPAPSLPVKEWTSEMFYWDAYAHHSMHAKLLKDSARTKMFQDVMNHNRHLFQGKVVLDVGCGLGLLSMMAARAGAARVVGVDCSAILEYTEEIVRANKLDDIITLVRGKVEEVNLPPDLVAVDIIICDWMGYSLFHRSLIGAVIQARLRWLKPSGLIFPDQASLFVCGFEDQKLKAEEINWWAGVYDFNMLALKDSAQETPMITQLHPSRVVTNACMVKEVNLYTATLQDLVFTAPFELKGTKSGHLHGLATYFVADFTKCHKAKELWTAPHSPPTHWKQTVFSFGCGDIPLHEGHTVSGAFTIHNVTANADNSGKTLQMSIQLDIHNGPLEVHEVYHYKMK